MFPKFWFSCILGLARVNNFLFIYFQFYRFVPAGPGAHQASCTMVTEDIFPLGKAAGAWPLNPYPHPFQSSSADFKQRYELFIYRCVGLNVVLVGM